MDPQRNAITRRLDKLRTLYGSFYDQPDAVLCHWSIKPDEARMIEAFYAAGDCHFSVATRYFLTQLGLSKMFQSFLTKPHLSIK